MLRQCVGRARLHVLAAGLCLALAAPAWSQATDPASAPAADTSDAVSAALDQAFADYARRAIALLSVSDSPRERWVAGLMLLGDAARASASMEESLALRNRAHDLFNAALRDGADDPVLLIWAALDPPSREEIDNDELAAARLQLVRQLQVLEPDNAVAWVAMLPAREAPGGIPVAIELLHKAADAKRFDTHFSASMQMLIAAYSRVPAPDPWPDTTGAPAWANTGPQDLPVIMAVGVASALAMPYLAELGNWCGDAQQQPWLEDCQRLAVLMVDGSEAIEARSLGVSLMTRTAAADSAPAQRADSLRRQMAWEVEMGLQRVGPGQPISFVQWRQAWDAPGANELTVATALLKVQDLPAQAPADYVPAWERQ